MVIQIYIKISKIRKNESHHCIAQFIQFFLKYNKLINKIINYVIKNNNLQLDT